MATEQPQTKNPTSTLNAKKTTQDGARGTPSVATRKRSGVTATPTQRASGRVRTCKEGHLVGDKSKYTPYLTGGGKAVSGGSQLQQVLENIDSSGIRVLRAGCDWLNFLIDTPTGEVFQRLLDVDTIVCGEVCDAAIVLRRRGRKGQQFRHRKVGQWIRTTGENGSVTETKTEEKTEVRENPSQLVFTGEGVYVCISAPEFAKRECGIWPIKIDVQGMMCSTSIDGLTAAEGACLSILRALFPHGIPNNLRMEAGRFDVFADVEISGDGANEWINSELFGNGNVLRARSRYTTRARAHTQELSANARDNATILGSESRGMTFYCGHNPQMRNYEKDRKFSTNRDLELCKKHWIANGWNGTSRVIRVEFQCTRDFLIDNDVELQDGTKRRLGGKESITYAEFKQFLPAIFLTLLNRTRHTKRGDTRRAKDRADSPLWTAIKKKVKQWENDIRAKREQWAGAKAIVTRRRRVKLERVQKTAEKSLVQLHNMWNHDLTTGKLLESSIAPTLDETAYLLAKSIIDGGSITKHDKLKRYIDELTEDCRLEQPEIHLLDFSRRKKSDLCWPDIFEQPQEQLDRKQHVTRALMDAFAA